MKRDSRIVPASGEPGLREEKRRSSYPPEAGRPEPLREQSPAKQTDMLRASSSVLSEARCGRRKQSGSSRTCGDIFGERLSWCGMGYLRIARSWSKPISTLNDLG